MKDRDDGRGKMDAKACPEEEKTFFEGLLNTKVQHPICFEEIFYNIYKDHLTER